MIRIQLLALLLAFSLPIATPFCASASFGSHPAATSISEDWKYLKLRDYMNMSFHEMTVLKGRELNIWDKISFKIMKMNINKELKKNPNMLVTEYYAKVQQKRLSPGAWVAITLAALLVLILIVSSLYSFH